LRQEHHHERGPRARSKGTLQERFSDEARFIKAWLENPGSTGAVSPSGKFLARTMARYVDPAIKGKVIELGPGTGPVTQALIQRGITPDRLILVEYDAAFCRLLERRYPDATVIQGDAYNLGDTLDGLIDGPIAAVVSSLPLLNRPEPDRCTLLRDAFGMLGVGGRFVQFTYGMVSPIPRRPKNGIAPVAFDAEASQPVWLNIPPARVWVYKPAPAVRIARKSPAEQLMLKIREGTGRVKDEILDTRDRIETEIRLAKDRMRLDLERQTSRMRDEPAMRPAMALLRKLGDGKRKAR
jgi:phosphatidylethanolamine/phosphatidyl-N-methylethanolamine N-methyltransferase